MGTPVLWIGFTLFVLLMLALDLGVFHRKAHEVKFKEALTWSIVWIGLALIFNLFIYTRYGPQKGLEFLTGYVVEKTLSVDNIFIFVVLFSSFAVPVAYQHRVLFWGILGALIMRAIFIALGAALLSRFHWVIFIFGGLLILTGIKLLINRDKETHPEKNLIFRAFQKAIPTVSEYHGSKFFIQQGGKWFATPLFLVLIAVEITDLVFAVDSIPAIFAITNDPFIVYTSNIFAILGLRSLYFLLAGSIDKLRYLKVGLALVLMFVGVKMSIVDFWKIPIGISLLVICFIIGASIAASLLLPKEKALSS